MSNGLLDNEQLNDDSDVLKSGGLAYSGNGVLKTNGLLDAVNETFKSNGLLDAMDEDRVPHELLDPAYGQEAAKNAQSDDAQIPVVNGHDVPGESQEELPNISQLLRPHTRGSTTLRASIPATTFDGKTIYLRKKVKTNKSRALIDGQRTTSLLEIPIHKLMDQLSETTAAKLAHPQAESSSSSVLTPVENELWVDRYRPSRFTDLLGDERVHRETMGWLKEWDHCVFGKRKANKQRKTFNNTFNNQDTDFQNAYEDAYHRPREKILLLSGPAGYGKTTLAHVAARQAGYEVLEINASDARSGQVIDDRIRPALESGSAIGSKKPVCVVIDEIDGATGAGENTSSFIHKLVALTFERAKKKGRADKGKDVRRPLLRPLVCICNDLYASSLTKLRQHARIIRFTRPADVYLTKRLRSICESEGLRAESRALTALVGISKGDMRGCLNTLQFIKARNQDVTEPVIRAATVGMKEGDASFASTLSSLFAPLPKKRVKELGLSELDENRYVGRLSVDVEASGSVDKIALGCFEHYTNLRHYEASLSRHGKAADWLMTFDMFSGTMRSEREYGLLPYLPFSLVPFYPLFNERGGLKVERPKADWENFTKTRTNEEVYKSLSKCIQSSAGQRSAGLRHLLTNEIMQLEFASYINRIISPPLRPVNSQVTRPQERALLARLVDIMVTLELRLVQEKAEDGQLVYRLDPPIDAFITYDGKRSADVAIQRYATRHLIAGEPPVDFFGRPITVSTAPSSKRNKGSGSTIVATMEQKYRVTYRYNEGNSAAVRKPVKVSSFL
ncbi:P-loop containing nucleoside triphosphate hydrolase protein [Phellopilus nigrolimitatus]|nr:P-loop containing nucleoside triphosphate hydrolase protein [Phellopilus nigrolimitatus]